MPSNAKQAYNILNTVQIRSNSVMIQLMSHDSIRSIEKLKEFLIVEKVFFNNISLNIEDTPFNKEPLFDRMIRFS